MVFIIVKPEITRRLMESQREIPCERSLVNLWLSLKIEECKKIRIIKEEIWRMVKKRSLKEKNQVKMQQFHKDNLRHLSRFPDFFVNFRILSKYALISSGGSEKMKNKIIDPPWVVLPVNA